ncbi:hypothetical protein NE237_023437 [Protea cynaroides]|uniref:rhamnogalacturonan endolyase n=1 Tax=Protea cynaroides TaxID=273540 RepID=A0A9Q0K6L9_9MAGN|nr:hypothetical protein NE237_023437 [Protea cynaroides]
MPMPEDRETSEPLAYPEAVILTHPIDPELKGEVDDKYQYPCGNQDCRVRGWISSDPPVGFWMIIPSNEFRTGGPVKQDLTSLVGRTILSMFVNLHYSGEYLSLSIRDGEHWKKVFGPVFIYLNSASAEGHISKLWDDAKQQGYQFWTRANSDGFFSINGARPGNYSLYGWVLGFLGDYKYGINVTITPGCKVNLGDLMYEPPSNDSVHVDKFRQYELWERYSELYPHEDLVYTIGTTDYNKDWFFAHVNRVPNETHMLRVAIASATASQLLVHLNKTDTYPVFSTRVHHSGGLERDRVPDGAPGNGKWVLLIGHFVYMKKMSWSQSPLLCLGLLLQLSLLADCSLKSEWTRGIPRRINVEVPASSSRLRLLIKHRFLETEETVNLVLTPFGNMSEEEETGFSSLRIHGSSFKVIKEAEDQIELSFTSTWYHSIGYKSVPLNVDKRFIMLPGRSGFYSYAIYEHLQGWPDFNLDETRIAFKLRHDLFRYMAISDQRQRIMPTPKDRKTGKRLAYPEAILLTHPSNPELKGEVDDKYQYSCENQHNRVHGWISSDPPVGFWMINPSDEFRTGGPVKQDLTSHVGPTTLSMFVSVHYSGEDLSMKIRNGEHWKKVFGPVFIYLNSASDEGHVTKLWDNAKQQMLTEVQNWPYSFPASNDFPSSDQRGTVTGRLFIQDRFLQKENIPADSAYLGLAAPGDIGSWQTESKGYQFWTRANSNGSFSINGVRPGRYNLYGWVPGFLGDYKYDLTITITRGSKLNLGHFIYEPPRQGPTLWEIGIPDRSAAEFYVPDPSRKYINKLYVANKNSDDKDSIPVDKFRQYGLWERYAELYPHEDLVYTVGTSDYSKDWFFAHVDRRNDDNTYKPTTWQIRFNLDKVTRVPNETHMLRVAIASATGSQLLVHLNNTDSYPVFSTSMIGRDNAIARHGIHGLYWVYNINIPSNRLTVGENIIFLTQSKHTGSFQGLMYDYIRLEGPSTSI